MAKNLWFPFYPDDYLSDTQELSTEDHGAYLLIIIELYRAGGELPYDEKMLRRITGLSAYKWKSFSKIFDKYFEKISQKFHHPRVSEQLCRQEAIQAQTSDINRKRAEKQWGVSSTWPEMTDAKQSKAKNRGIPPRPPAEKPPSPRTELPLTGESK